ncbi:hypothetical protein [Halocatena pleomorpha]|nr:hypothetical protein [Halocatena pleomorpha]
MTDHDCRRTVRSAALRSLTERRKPPTPKAVRTITLQALYTHHPHVALEDVLELRVLLEGPRRETPIDEQVDTVLETALNELTKWNMVSPVSV